MVQAVCSFLPFPPINSLIPRPAAIYAIVSFFVCLQPSTTSLIFGIIPILPGLRFLASSLAIQIFQSSQSVMSKYRPMYILPVSKRVDALLELSLPERAYASDLALHIPLILGVCFFYWFCCRSTAISQR